MATVTHYIRSDYDPEDREKIEIETGQRDVEKDATDPWLTVKAFGASRRVVNPPVFVAATAGYDDWMTDNPNLFTRQPDDRLGAGGVSSWYRSLTRTTPSATPPGSALPSRNVGISRTTLSPKSSRSTSREPVKKDGNVWFISRALESKIAGGSTPPISTPSPTLADILSRDPPPLPSERPFTPPVWLALGPGNKGFAMLQRSGWREGEALGRSSSKRSGLGHKHKGADVEGQWLIHEEIKKEVIDLVSDDNAIVDLTLSDEDGDENLALEEVNEAFDQVDTADHPEDSDDLDHNPRALLTPLPTILKSDRLGIGLKAKTIGPYRESVKKITHSQAALAAHIKASEDFKKLKKTTGRGRRGFERMKKNEEDKRKKMLTYLNAD